MPWSEVRGQEEALNFLRRSLEGGRLAHAYLFHGPEGVGKKMAALLLCRFLVCRGASKPCGTCPACRRLLSGGHPDVMVLEPLGKARRITKEQMAHLHEGARLCPSQGEWKVFVLDDAETMGTEAANSLLKFLEEPPAGTLFLLVSSRPELLPPTVVSRCQLVRFRSWPAPLLREFARGLAGDEAGVDLLVSLAAGSPGLLAGLIEGKWLETRALVLDLLRRVREGSPPGGLTGELLDHLLERDRAAGEAFSGGALRAGLSVEARKAWVEARTAASARALRRTILEIILGWYRDLYLFQVTGREDIINNHDRIQEIRSASGSLTRGRIAGALRALEASREALLRRHSPPELVFESLLAELGPGSG